MIYMQRNAFSLVELSIVLVILGLLTGGILAGQSLIRAAELRGVSSDISKYVAATHAFRDKYFAVPGDMRNATSFWGNADTGTIGGECAAPADDAGTGTQTCNGNGNGIIGSDADQGLSNSELFRFWQHLASAGMIEGQFTGVASNNPAGGTMWRVGVPGTNLPRSRLPNGGVYALHHPIQTNGGGGANSWTGGDTAQVRPWMFIGRATAGDIPFELIVKPEELWNIDTKLDDGRPGIGTVRSPTAVPCTTTNVPATAEYALTTSTIICVIAVDMKI